MEKSSPVCLANRKTKPCYQLLIKNLVSLLKLMTDIFLNQHTLLRKSDLQDVTSFVIYSYTLSLCILGDYVSKHNNQQNAKNTNKTLIPDGGPDCFRDNEI